MTSEEAKKRIEQLTREQFDVLIKKKFFVRSGLLKKVE